MNDYYVYIYLDPRKPGKYKYGRYKFSHEPIYVGKGKGNRSREFSMHNKSIQGKVRNIGINEIIIIVCEEKLSEKNAFALEKEMIATIGRFDLRIGPLFNFTQGGEGTGGMIFSDLHRLRIAESKKGKRRSKETCKKMSESKKGFKHSEDACRKISEAGKGRIVTLETRKKISESIKKSRYKFGGKPTPPEVKEKISNALKGRISPTKGMRFPNRAKKGLL